MTRTALRPHTEVEVQLIGKCKRSFGSHIHEGPSTLVELREGEEGVLESLDLPDDIARRLMELGFLPGSRITAARSAPGGDPRVFRVDGSEVAVRRETAAQLTLRVPQ